MLESLGLNASTIALIGANVVLRFDNKSKFMFSIKCAAFNSVNASDISTCNIINLSDIDSIEDYLVLTSVTSSTSFSKSTFTLS